MLSVELATNYPELSVDGGREKSPKTPRYNCIAWAAEWDDQRWWQPDTDEPGMYWPRGVPDDGSLRCYVELFKSLGYVESDPSNAAFEVLHEKVAIYANFLGHFTHVARQTHSGIWWSKLGENEDVSHGTPRGLEGANYGKVSHIMKRPCGLRTVLIRLFYMVLRVALRKA